MSGACDHRQPALQALFDGELDALASAELEAHVQTCPICQATIEQMDEVRSLLRTPGLQPATPPALRARIEAIARPRQVPIAPPAPRPWRAWAGGAVGGALAASLALFLALPQLGEPAIADQLVGDHIRSLQAAHLVDVQTSDRHVVKPWFNGKVDFSPPVVDLAARGFPLAGGRLDILDGRTVAALVYKRRLHSINLFVRPAAGAARLAPGLMREGSYSLEHWTSHGLEYWAVSDIEPGELGKFARLFRGQAGE
jgi:anti-sigma factor RsiW